MELRKDPITRSWILTGDQETPPPPPVDCPYCNGTAGQPIFSMTCGQSENCGTLVFPHPNPLYRIEGPPGRAAAGIYDRMQTVGAHEVIIENPRHDLPLWVAPDESVERVLTTCAQRIEDLKRDARFRYVCIFKNSGAAAGQEITHAHSELTATPFIPRRLIYELTACRDYYHVKERCVFCDILQQEERTGARVVEATANFIALCPFASRVPYETWLLPREHNASFESGILASAHVREFAGLVRRTLARLASLVDSFHLVVHTTPNVLARPEQEGKWNTLADDYHWHFEIMPIVQKVSRSYSIKEVYYCPLSPEHAAARLRAVSV